MPPRRRQHLPHSQPSVQPESAGRRDNFTKYGASFDQLTFFCATDAEALAQLPHLRMVDLADSVLSGNPTISHRHTVCRLMALQQTCPRAQWKMEGVQRLAR